VELSTAQKKKKKGQNTDFNWRLQRLLFTLGDCTSRLLSLTYCVVMLHQSNKTRLRFTLLTLCILLSNDFVANKTAGCISD